MPTANLAALSSIFHQADLDVGLQACARLLACAPALTEQLIQIARQTPDDHLPGYMMRYWLITPEQAQADGLPFHGLRFHNILREDRDRHLHNHPWSFRSLILRGGYTEQLLLPDNTIHTIERTAGDCYRRSGTEYHRISAISKEPVWTLCVLDAFHGNRWGFNVDDKHVDSHTYLNY